MYVKCQQPACQNKAWLRPCRKYATCDRCKALTIWLTKVHGEKPDRARLTDAENQELKTLERITVKVGH